MFFPRGGSAQVVRYLSRAMVGQGWSTRVVAGSLGGPDDPGNARAFFGPDTDLVAVPYDAAVGAPDPLLASPPMQPSYEDRPGAPDRAIASLDDRIAHHLADEWTRILGAPGVLDGVELAHLHHLTPIHEAVARLRPDLPVVTHLHGTELLMLEEADRGAVWPHEREWRARMRRWAQSSTRVIVSSEPSGVDAVRLLGIDPGRMVVVPNGVNLTLFSGPPASANERASAASRQWLCEKPRGWSPALPHPGDVRYSPEQIAPLLDPGAVVTLYVGRFTAVKRAALLVRAHARAREQLGRPLPLLLVGGAPGEWEGEHPADAAARSPWGHEVFFAGWRSHDELAQVLACGDLLAVPSVAERFGQVYVEAMAMRLPVIACRRRRAADLHRRRSRVARPQRMAGAARRRGRPRPALVAAASDPVERAIRGENGRRCARERFPWEHVARSVAEIYAAATEG